VDRRRFLLGVAWTGLAAGLGSLASSCAPAPLPNRYGTRAPTTPAGPSSTQAGSPSASSSPSEPPRDTPVAMENRLVGTRDWDVRPTKPQGATGFLSSTSVAPGEILGVHVACSSTYDIDWYRLGWYSGDGGRLVRSDMRLPGAPSAPALITAPTGRAEAPWPPALSIEIPADWQTGMYLAILRPAIGGVGLLPFIVRPLVGRTAPVLFVSASATWQAYNLWGGANLYDAATADSLTVSAGRRAFEVSFDRPYQADGGAGYARRWELQFIRWQEREGRDVDYASDVDLQLHPEVVEGRRLLVFAGHH